jgi:putative oxidoreductase
MNIAAVVARILLGLAFVAAGASGFFLINNPPPAPPGLAGTFQDVFFQSRWVLFVDAIELLAGALLLANRFIALALTLLGAVIANIIAYHVTLMPAGLPAAAIVTLLWGIVAVRYRASLAPLFVQQV